MSDRSPDAVAEATDLLLRSGTRPADEMLALAKRLAQVKQFGLARRIMKRARVHLNRSEVSDDDLYCEVFQKSALYTYKDPDLPRDWALDRALEILGMGEDLARTERQETLGLAGAICKRKWEVDGQRQNLDRSLFYYLRGYALGIRREHVTAATEAGQETALAAARADVIRFLHDNPESSLWAEKDRGYCGINAAFVLDLLAADEEDEARRAGLVSIVAGARRAGAQAIRREIARSVPPHAAGDWWAHAAIGEAYFGLGSDDPAQHREALEWLVAKPRSASLDVPEWEYESTARQLARLARLQGDPDLTEEEFEATPAGRALAEFLGRDEKAVSSAFRGKFGLGLSGGGFRAALFHIGLLARLAEHDVLRHVEVLSCVSGGSVIGAHYYLEIRKLLETKADDEITREHYIDIVRRVQADFLAGVQRNIRTRVLAEWTTNLKFAFASRYTRTLRVGELYERELFSYVEDIKDVKDDKDGGFRSPRTGPKWLPDWLARPLGYKREARFLDELMIHPKLSGGGKDTDFNPRNHNWRRRNKVPILVLNTTSLNTGHIWQFTASYMGEPPTPINKDIDSNFRLRRMYYKDAPEGYRKIRLGTAVAASSCVPGLFEPILLDDLYPDGGDKLQKENLIDVRLVDGGACDNQGIGTLLEQDCTVMLVSDASGQMGAVNQPGGNPLSVLLRTSSVSQARVREAHYSDVAARKRSSLLRDLLFIHLRQDLAGESVAWKDCPSSLKESDFENAADRADATSYGVSTSVQQKLSALRTDLDSFTDAEAYALMASAYRMTAQQLDGTGSIQGFPPPAKTESWSFLAVDDALKPQNEPERRHLERLLDAGASLAFKIWKLSRPLQILAGALLAALLAAVLWLFATRWDDSILSILPPAAVQWVTSWTFKKVGLLVLSALALALVTAAGSALIGKKRFGYVLRVAKWRDTLKSIAIGVGMSFAGFLVARLHLHVFDRLFLRYGKIRPVRGTND
jgi:predicted acylesterase/phospholipase RssA